MFIFQLFIIFFSLSPPVIFLSPDFFFFAGGIFFFGFEKFFLLVLNSTDTKAEPGRASRARVPNPAQVGGLRRNVKISGLSNCGVRHFTNICTRHTWCAN